jgi:chemosensory pili system protein ChpA (sensor histidine kinase/response regulator)
MATVDTIPWSTLKDRALQAADSLQQALASNQDSDKTAFIESFTQYAELWQEIANEALSCGLDGLCDVCMLFVASALDVDPLEQGLDKKHGKLLEKWQTLFIAYLDAPEKNKTRNDLVRYLQNPFWAEPLPDDDADMLKEGLLVPDTVVAEAEVEDVNTDLQPEQQSADDNWSILKNQVLETAAPLKQLLTYSQDNNHSELTESFTQYAELWEQIANEAYSYGLEGLCDVSMLFHASALDVDQLEQGLDKKHGQLLKKWQTLFIAYLDAPEQDKTRNDLIRYLQDPLWAEPLPDDDVDMLAGLLLPEQVAVDTEEVIEDIDLNPALEAEPEDMTADDLDLDLNLDLETDEQDASSTVKAIAPDLLELIRTQFEPYAESIFVALESEYAKTLVPEKFSLAMLPQLDELEMLSKVSETLGLEGLQKVFEVLHDNMQELCANKLMLEEAQSQLLTSVMSCILHYIANIENVARRTLLAEHFKNPHWPSPLSENEVQALVMLFDNVCLQSREEIIGVREIASADDVLLTIQDDVNPELLESLFNELPALTEEFTEAVQQLLQSGSITDVEKAQRIAHTLKGSGNLAGITGIATLTHNIEEIMEKVALHGSVPKGVFDTLLIDCADCLEAMSDCVLGRGSAPDNALILLQQLLDLAYQIKAEGIPESVEVIPLAKPKTEGFVASGIIPAATEAQPIEKTAETPTESSPDSVETTTRISSSLVEDMLRMAGENNILTGQIQQRLNETIEQNHSMREQNAWLLNLIAELEQLIEEQGNLSQDSSTVLNEEFDPLEMDQYNELHTCANRLLEVVTDAKAITTSVDSQLDELKDLLVVQERLQKENHELVLQTRMVPVQSIASRLQRTIRQASRTTGKKVELRIIGSDTLIDSDILNSLIDSLLHLLRNAVDHGIESSEQRLAAGKAESGNITLAFSLRGNQIIVVCQDDGGGLDLVRIREIAEQKNLITADASLSEQELQRLVLKPGFSTRDSATQLSGRGIGMNAVHDQVLKLKGELDIDSEFGSGSRITLALPATLVSVRALLVRSGNQLIAVSNRGLEQILYPGAGKLKTLGNDLAYQQGEKLYSAKRFESIINISVGDNASPEGSLSAMLFKMETGEIKAILVDQVVDSRELIVKNMGQYVPKINGVAGATILGDGSVTPVLDIPELLRANHSQAMAQQFGLGEQTDSNRRAHRHALIIDDSLSARRSLAQLLSDMDYDVSTAIDGIDAIEKMEQKLPDIILVDLEMPRMNGLELTSHVRNRVDTKNVPVIMVTSRATDKHRQQAKNAGVNVYLTKPFSENEIMDQINKAAEGTV